MAANSTRIAPITTSSQTPATPPPSQPRPSQLSPFGSVTVESHTSRCYDIGSQEVSLDRHRKAAEIQAFVAKQIQQLVRHDIFLTMLNETTGLSDLRGKSFEVFLMIDRVFVRDISSGQSCALNTRVLKEKAPGYLQAVIEKVNALYQESMRSQRPVAESRSSSVSPPFSSPEEAPLGAGHRERRASQRPAAEPRSSHVSPLPFSRQGHLRPEYDAPRGSSQSLPEEPRLFRPSAFPLERDQDLPHVPHMSSREVEFGRPRALWRPVSMVSGLAAFPAHQQAVTATLDIIQDDDLASIMSRSDEEEDESVLILGTSPHSGRTTPV